jgi:hypothetical protein
MYLMGKFSVPPLTFMCYVKIWKSSEKARRKLVSSVGIWKSNTTCPEKEFPSSLVDGRLPSNDLKLESLFKSPMS